MQDVQIIISGIWIALMLTYLLGDVMRIFAGDFKPGEIEGTKMTQNMLLGMAIFMLIPIIMVVLSLTLPQEINKIINLIAPIGLFIFNIAGLPTYKSKFDKFLIIVGLAFNVITVFYAWTWI